MNGTDTDILKDLWSADENERDYSVLSNVAVKSAQSTVFKMKLFGVLEIFAAIIVTIFLLMRVWQASSWLHICVDLGTVISLVILQFYLTKWRRKFWASPGLSLKDNAKFHLEHARFNLRMAYITLWGGPLGLCLGFLVGLFEPLSKELSTPKLIVFALCIIGFITIALFRLGKAKTALTKARLAYEIAQ